MRVIFEMDDELAEEVAYYLYGQSRELEREDPDSEIPQALLMIRNALLSED